MYNYENEKQNVFTADGFNMLEKIKANANGREVFTVQELMSGLSGDSWMMLACIDFLVENGTFKYRLKKGMKQDYVLSR
jgi:hypothetical protein